MLGKNVECCFATQSTQVKKFELSLLAFDKFCLACWDGDREKEERGGGKTGTGMFWWLNMCQALSAISHTQTHFLFPKREIKFVLLVFVFHLRNLRLRKVKVAQDQTARVAELGFALGFVSLPSPHSCLYFTPSSFFMRLLCVDVVLLVL